MCIRRRRWCSRLKRRSSALQQLIEQTENNISILLGRNPGPITRGLNLIEQPHLPEVPAGLPSALLQRRPDVRRAEENLVAANANVGVAKAAFFPQISLTGIFGAQSTAITSFLQGPATFWAVGGQAVQPIFQGGRIRSQLPPRMGATRRSGVGLQADRACRPSETSPTASSATASRASTA